MHYECLVSKFTFAAAFPTVDDRIFLSWFVIYLWLEGYCIPEDGHDDGWIVKMPKISGRDPTLSHEGLTSAAEESVV